MQYSNNIFRNYDIRGIYPSELNEDTVFHLGLAMGTILRKKKEHPKVVISRDDRKSSPSLSRALISGFENTGCYVTDIGISITPVIHFLTTDSVFDMGLNVTASHNPKEYNGIRIDYRNAKSFYGDLILMLRFMLERGAYTTGQGKVESKDLTGKYIDYLVKSFKFNKKIKVVVDCGSGATSNVAPEIFKKLGCDVLPVYCRYDSNFPHGVPDPENRLFMHDLKHYVLDSGADVGLAYDTDGDRFGMVDEKGQMYATDQMLLLYSKHVLKKYPGRTVVYDVKSSALLDHYIKEFGGIPKVMRTGHPYFGDEVANKAILGAEFSGHIYFSDRYFGYDDGVYASLRLVEILSKSKQTLSEMMAEFPQRHSTGEIKVDCPDDMKFKVINILKIYLMKNIKYKKVVDIDGVRMLVTDSGWILIRASNTTPILSIRAEGKDDQEKEMLLQIIRDALKSVSIIKLDINF